MSIEIKKYSGWEPLMVCGDSMSIRVLKRAYRKHVKGDDSIGWEELSDELGTALAQIMGDDEFCEWTDSLNKKG